MKIIVTNNNTHEIINYDDLTKARIAVDYLTTFTPYLWFLKILPN